MIAPKAFNMFPEFPVVLVGKVTSGPVTGPVIIGQEEIARSQAIPVSHSSVVTTAFEPKKS